MKKLLNSFNTMMSRLEDIPLLLLRLLVAFVFYKPAILKFQKTEVFVKQFVERGIPMPEANVFISGSLELLGVILLILGLGTRYISSVLLVIILVAVFTSEMKEGWYNSLFFKIHFFYILSLILFITKGAGKISIDHLIGKKRK